MKKSMIAAGALAGSFALAFASSAQSDLVDIKFTVDHAQSAEAIYEQVLDKADDVCGRDTFCQEALVDALVDAIDQDAVSAIHAARTDQPFQVASSDPS